MSAATIGTNFEPSAGMKADCIIAILPIISHECRSLNGDIYAFVSPPKASDTAAVKVRHRSVTDFCGGPEYFSFGGARCECHREIHAIAA